MTVHIYAPPVIGWDVQEKKCPTCEVVTKFLRESLEWHPAHWTCLMCGDSWSDGERMERPFKPKWRQKSVAEAEKRIKKYQEAM